jgi:hypothetical protein
MPLSVAGAWAVGKDTPSIAALEALRQQRGKDNPVFDRPAKGWIAELKRQEIDNAPS